MVRQPLFIRFSNGDMGPTEVVDAIRRSLPGRDDPRAEYTHKVLDGAFLGGGPVGMDQFRSDFRNMLDDVIEGGFSKEVTSYLTAYTSASLEEFEDSTGYGNRGSSTRFAGISSPESPWLEGYVCYNFMLYVKGFGRSELKRCKDCNKFFTGRGKYAAYCTDLCRNRNKTDRGQGGQGC